MINKKAFTLIELLVVVAIIGILAAVGVTTFNGFQEKAKISASKANHKNVVKFISTEMQKCELFGYVQLKYNEGNKNKIYNVTCDSQGQTTRDMALSFNVHFRNIGFKNPFDTSQDGVACNLSPNYNSCGYKGAVKGQVIISITGSNVPKGNTFRVTTKISNSETLTTNFDDPRY